MNKEEIKILESKSGRLILSVLTVIFFLPTIELLCLFEFGILPNRRLKIQ